MQLKTKKEKFYIILIAPFLRSQRGGQAKFADYFRDFPNEEFIYLDIKLPEKKSGILFLLPRFFVFLRVLFTLIYFIIIKPVKIIHIFTPCNKRGIFEKLVYGFIGKIFQKKIILNLRGDLSFYYPKFGKKSQLLLKKMLCFCDVVICQYHKLKTYIVKKGLLEERKIVVINNGIHLDEIRKTKTKKDQIITQILFLGTVSEKKGIKTMLEATHILKCDFKVENFLVNICGPFPNKLEKDYFLAQVKEKRIHNQIKYKGIITGEKKAEIFNDTDIFVLPSYTEGFPNSLLEAMLAELPIIATKVGAIPEIIKDGENGFLIKIKDSKKLSKKLFYLINSKIKREEMGKRNRKKIEKKYDIKLILEHYNELYSSLIQNKN